MEKIPTLFLRNLENMKLVTREVNPDAAWVLDPKQWSSTTATVKKDGTNAKVRVLNGQCDLVWKRRNPSREEKALGAEPAYVQAYRDDPADKHIFAAVDATDFTHWPSGEWSVEVLGPKVQGGVESDVPCLYAFSLFPAWIPVSTSLPIPKDFDSIRDHLGWAKIEGIVWHHRDGRMSKIKRRDFGLPWPVKKP